MKKEPSSASVNWKTHGYKINELCEKYKIEGEGASEKLVNLLNHFYKHSEILLSHKPSETGNEAQRETQNQELLQFQQTNKCPNCMARPFSDKNGRLKIVCTRPVFKQNRYENWIPSGKEKGEIPLETCIAYLKYQLNKEAAIEEKEQRDIALLKTKEAEQHEQILKLQAEVTHYKEKDADKCQATLESMQKGESIICRLKNNSVIPLGECFEIQDEQKEMPESFTPINERCPCDHFRHLERLEMQKYENPETVPFIDAEIHKQYLENLQKIDMGTYKIEDHPPFEGYKEQFKKTMDILKKLNAADLEKDLAQHKGRPIK